MKKHHIIAMLLTLILANTAFADSTCQWYRIDNRTTTSSHGSDKFIISYPYFSGDCLEHANAAFDFLTQTIKDQFILDESSQDKKASAGNELNLDYQIIWISPKYMSFRIYVLTYLAGQAHPVTKFQSINYNMNTQQVLKLADLFNKDSKYLDTLVTQSRVLLEKTIISTDADKDAAEKWIEAGTEAKEENFSTWNLTDEGLMITFQPMQVTDYAQGKQQVIIPYNVLQSEFKPEVWQDLQEKFGTPLSSGLTSQPEKSPMAAGFPAQ